MALNPQQPSNTCLPSQLQGRKIKSSLWLIKHYATKTFVEVEVQLHAYLM